MSERLDLALVRRALARSRGHAKELIDQGRVRVDGRPAAKSSAGVEEASLLEVAPGTDFVSRAGHKLAGALADFGHAGPQITGRRCLDAGASTGGFTEVLLRQGAAAVVAVDVGHDQLAPALRSDPRVRNLEGANLRDVQAETLGGPVELAVADLSFISLTAVLPALVGLVVPDGDLVVMVKPQFEVGRARLTKSGVVRDPRLRVEAVRAVVDCAAALGWHTRAATTSAVPGPSGNVEFFVWLRTEPPVLASADLDDLVGAARRWAGGAR